jgi:hypothetical protein
MAKDMTEIVDMLFRVIIRVVYLHVVPALVKLREPTGRCKSSLRSCE